MRTFAVALVLASVAAAGPAFADVPARVGSSTVPLVWSPATIAKVKDGSFTAEDYGQFSTMKFGGASLAPFGSFEDKIPAVIKELVKTREQEIREGLYRVNVNDSEPKSSV